MSVLVIAAAGVLLVLLSILLFKLHPLMALLLGSLLLFALTPSEVRLENYLESLDSEIVAVDGKWVEVNRLLPESSYFLFSKPESVSRTIEQRGPFQLVPVSVVCEEVAGEISTRNRVRYEVQTEDGPIAMRAGERLVQVADLAKFTDLGFSAVGGQLGDGFAKTFRRLGIPVTMAAIVGICLLESGAAARLVGAIIGLFGPRGTAPALTLSGFVLGVPVYFDNVFYLLLPLAKAVGRQRPAAYLTAVMAIIVGATMAHSLVPPTPGPLLVASLIHVNVGLMMLGGLVVGGTAAMVGLAYGSWCHRWVTLPELDSSEQIATDKSIPLPLWLSAIPIALPILALGGSEIVEYLAGQDGASSSLLALQRFVTPLNDANLIFLGTAVVAVGILRYVATQAVVGKAVAKGIADAGVIVLLTCAGGAFGAALQQLRLADAIGQQFAGLTTPWGVLLTAFFLTTIIRAAQGSATVAMVTSAAIVAPVIANIDLPFHPLYIALAIGCGSKPLPWMNDSGFWQVATMTGMNTSQTLKTFTVALTLMGLTGFAITALGAYLFPLI